MAHYGLCEGRHEIKQNNGEALDGFIFGQVDSPLDFDSHEKQILEWHTAFSWSNEDEDLYLYVTGLTPLLTTFLKLWYPLEGGDVILMHYDRDSQSYVEQPFKV